MRFSMDFPIVKGFRKMNKILVIFLVLLALGLGAVAIVSHNRACKAEKALAELRNSMASTCGDSPHKKGDSPRSINLTGTVPKCVIIKEEMYEA